MTKGTYFSLEVLPARKGDCLLLYHGTGTVPKLSIIDGGPSSVYQSALRPRLAALRENWEIGDNDPLLIDLLMVSHIDDDHIKGLLDMAKELKEQSHKPPLVRIDTLWHNAFDDIVGNRPHQALAAANGLASVMQAQGPSGFSHDDQAVFASVGQGYDLRNYARFFQDNGKGWEVNRPDGGLIMMAADDDPPISIFSGFEITLLGPRKSAVEKLQKQWDKFLTKKGLGQEDEGLASLPRDRSITNLSSIVALLESDGKSILLTGDALGSEITDALRARGLICDGTPLHVNVLKIQHHGSDRNATPEFFEQVRADHYVFSGDGSHGNPERATLEMFFASHDDRAVTLHFSTGIDVIDERRKKEAIDHGKDWKHQRDSLRALLDVAAPLGGPTALSEPANGQGPRIDLRDAVPESAG